MRPRQSLIEARTFLQFRFALRHFPHQTSGEITALAPHAVQLERNLANVVERKLHRLLRRVHRLSVSDRSVRDIQKKPDLRIGVRLTRRASIFAPQPYRRIEVL